MGSTPEDFAHDLLTLLYNDRENVLIRIDDYIHGKHDDPYMPSSADAEYRLLAKRSITNWVPLLISTPCQALYVDSFRRGDAGVQAEGDEGDEGDEGVDPSISPEWLHFERSGLAAKQASIYRSTVGYGHAFTLTELNEDDKAITKGLSPLRTSALFDDPANDIVPEAALTVRKFETPKRRGEAHMWIGGIKYLVTFASMLDKEGLTVKELDEVDSMPITRFTAHLDLEGRTTGVVEPIIPIQNRINQSVFDLLVAQTYGSFQVRTATGMAPPMEMEPVFESAAHNEEYKATGKIPIGADIVGVKPAIDANTGQPKYKNIDLNARRMLFAEDPEARFGSLEGTPLEGFIASIDLSVRHLSAISQTPPHHLLGQIANLSAEALQAAETSLSRMVEGFRKSFGESWERVFRLAAELEGDTAAAVDYSAEVLWRDMELHSMSQVSDALGKLAESLGIPAQGLWSRVPGATKNEVDEWKRLAKETNPQVQLGNSIDSAVTAFTAANVNDDTSAAA